uniref:Uncharacterized protein n=1 Tax=Xiphophorus couchianus TaxID=32473 RepID=A0A3B5MJJ8_9TELE
MMSMGFMPDSVNGSDPSKSAFLEFGHGHPAHQQHSPGLSHIYPLTANNISTLRTTTVGCPSIHPFSNTLVP